MRLISDVESGEVTLCVSAQILRELRSVLNRSEVRTALPGIDDLRIEQVALGVGMKEKAEEFVAAGAEIYQGMARQD